MLLQEFGHDFVLLRELGLSGRDLPVFAVIARRPFRGGLKGGRPVLKEQLLPAVKLSGQDLVFVASVGDRDFVDQVSFDDRDFVRRGKLSSLFLYHASFRLW